MVYGAVGWGHSKAEREEEEELWLQSQKLHLVSLSSTQSGIQVLVCGHLELFDSSFPG